MDELEKLCRRIEEKKKDPKFQEEMRREAERELDFELRANFEPGTVVVDVITGERRKV